MVNLRNVFLTLFFSISYLNISAQNELEWMVDKAIRLTEYKESKELRPVMAQISDKLGQVPMSSEHLDSKQKIIYQLDQIDDLFLVIHDENINFRSIGKALYKIKLELAIIKLRSITQKNDADVRLEDNNIIAGLESINAASISLDLDEKFIEKVNNATAFFQQLRIGQLKNKNLKKGRQILENILNHSHSKE